MYCKHRVRGLQQRRVVSDEEKAAIVENLKQWIAGGGVEKAVKPSANADKINVQKVGGRRLS